MYEVITACQCIVLCTWSCAAPVPHSCHLARTYTHTYMCCAVCASCLQAAELRKKNSEYQKRSRGTFFSGEYLDWLEAQQQDLLETASNGLLSSLSCASSCSCPIEGSQDGEEPVRVSGRVGYVCTYVCTCMHS